MAGAAEQLDDSSAVSSAWILHAAKSGSAGAGMNLQGLLAKRLLSPQVRYLRLMLLHKPVTSDCFTGQDKHISILDDSN